MDPESHLKFGLRILLMALFAMMASFAYGQSREAIQYEYDGAGNIIRIETAFSENPPSITNISPNVLRNWVCVVPGVQEQSEDENCRPEKRSKRVEGNLIRSEPGRTHERKSEGRRPSCEAVLDGPRTARTYG